MALGAARDSQANHRSCGQQAYVAGGGCTGGGRGEGRTLLPDPPPYAKTALLPSGLKCPVLHCTPGAFTRSGAAVLFCCIIIVSSEKDSFVGPPGSTNRHGHSAFMPRPPPFVCIDNARNEPGNSKMDSKSEIIF